jgi:Fe-S oxidoreductase
MEYTPRKLIAMMRAGFVEDVICSQSLMQCVTCYSCMAKCPRGIKLTEVLLPFIKEKTFENLMEVPAELQKSFEDTNRYGNPLGESPRKRPEWTKKSKVPVRILKEDKSPVDVLWVVECYPSYYPRNIDATLATARLFKRLGIDFAILGDEEHCVGESQRIFGELGLFESLMEKNMKAFDKYAFLEIVTSGVHAYDALIRQYKDAGLKQPVQQTVQFLHSHLDKLKPLLKKELKYTVTYHDSCVLGKHNKVFNEPRELLKAIPGVKLVEMAHTMENSLCCGGGGGGMWLDTYYKEKGMERLSDMRVKEAVAAGAQVLAVSCPYEVSRFEDAAKLLGVDDKLKVRDVVELLDESAGGVEGL